MNAHKIATLYYLERLKLFGFKYVQINDTQDSKIIEELPNDLDTLKNITQNCHLCELSKSRKNVVFGEGNPKATLMFIGEGPGAFEDESGRPFVGKAGQLLTRIIENVLLLKRSDVYIANIVKCRPPNNRVPTQTEADCCKDFLFKQIEIIKPKIIVSLGSTSYKYLTSDMQNSISRVRGEIIQFNGIKLIPTFHPSFLLRNPSAKKDVYKDMLKVKTLLTQLTKYK